MIYNNNNINVTIT